MGGSACPARCINFPTSYSPRCNTVIDELPSSVSCIVHMFMGRAGRDADRLIEPREWSTHSGHPARFRPPPRRERMLKLDARVSSMAVTINNPRNLPQWAWRCRTSNPKRKLDDAGTMFWNTINETKLKRIRIIPPAHTIRALHGSAARSLRHLSR